MKKRLIDKIDFFSIGMNLLLISILNFSLYGIFLFHEERIDSKGKLIFFIFLCSTGNIIILKEMYCSNRRDKKNKKEMQERIEKENLTKDSFIKKYLSNEKYKEFQEMLNDLQENEKEDFRDLIFSELLKKQAEKYIKGGNDN